MARKLGTSFKLIALCAFAMALALALHGCGAECFDKFDCRQYETGGKLYTCSALEGAAARAEEQWAAGAKSTAVSMEEPAAAAEDKTQARAEAWAVEPAAEQPAAAVAAAGVEVAG